ncbi:MAG: HAMP domain-containing sensor histidine kinase [Bacilli bacterium]|nr:HAMP domain-containing sensor histidine kinase [Bacilli bacterium]
MHNKYFHKLIITSIIVVISALIISVIVSNYFYNKITDNIIDNNASIIGSIIDNHPELEDEIVTFLLNDQKDINKGLEILKKYGLDKEYNLSSLKNNLMIKRFIIVSTISVNALTIVTLILVYYFYMKKNSKKIKQINEYMYQVLNGNYTLDIREYEEGEISILKNDIYKITTILKEQTEKSDDDKKHLESVLSDISHQLKTPLTSMYVINDLLSKDDIDAKVKKDFLTKNKKQLERIEWLVSSLLKMSRLDSGSVELKKEKINLETLINDAIEPLRIPIELKKQTIIVKIDQNIFVNIDYYWTLEALINIIKNAHEHTNQNGLITIEATDNHIFTQISISDNGNGISKEDLPHIFERFYKSKNSSKDSIGIGLNMTKTIINKQNGDIKVTSKVLEGTTFYIKLYKMII